ncbi:MAG: T9SS type A sorting domain-containing protein [Rhodothermales bacterium]
MKQRPFVLGSIILGTFLSVLIISLVYSNPFSSSDEDPLDVLEVRSEKSKRMANMGHPDLFAEYHQQIRESENGQSYAINYKLDALAKAQSARKSPGKQLPWIERGPGHVGGRTRAIVVDESDETQQTWFAGSVGGGIWLTENAGLSWRVLTDNLPNLAIASMAQSISNPDVLYAGTGEGFGNLDAVSGAGIFKTVDHGETWTQLEATITADYQAVNRLVVDPEDENVAVAATNTGIFRTQNGGTSWTQVYDDVSRVQDLKFQPGNFDVQFATDNGCCILKSTDAGQTWDISYNAFFNGGARIELATSTANPDWVYAAVELTSAPQGGDIYFTMDAGATWTLAEDPNGGPANDWLNGQGWYDNAIAVHPFSPDTVFMGGVEFWKSNLTGSETSTGGAPTAFNEINTNSFLDFINFSGGSHFGGRVDIGTLADQLVNVTLDDMRSVEVRFGPGQSQMAHRFSVSPTAGTNGDGGAGIAYASYIYEDYVEVPFEVWDIDNNVQLMASFRDQADDGVYNLLASNTAGARDTQSREYLFIHAIPYSATTPDPLVGINGGAGQKTLYFMWPILATGGTWDAQNLPDSQLQLIFNVFEARVRAQSRFAQRLESGGSSVHVDHHNITILPVNAATNEFRIINGNDGGVYYSDDSGSLWKDANNGYVTTQFYDADKRAGTDDYIAGAQDNGTWRSFANPTLDSDWRFVNGGDGFELFWHPTDINKAIFSFQNNGFVKTDNGGFTASLATTGLTDTNADAPFITALGWSKERPEVLFAVGRRGIWRSDNFADTWTLAQSVDDAQWGFFSGCKVRVSLADPDIVWAGCRVDAAGGSHTLHLSRDGGQSFDPVPRPADMEGSTFISGLATHPSSPGTAYVLFSAPGAPKIFRTTNSGAAWEDLSGFAGAVDDVSTNGFPDVAIHDLLVLPNLTNEIWAATEVGIFSSKDSGETWAYADNGLPAVSVWRLRHVEDEVVAATHGRGVWTVSEPLEVANESEEVPEDFNLAQNYPNPFNPQTTIEFSVPAATDLQLKIFDLSGREIATLADGFYTAGVHNIAWDAGQFASGVYVYRMTAGDYTATQRMTLVK